MKWVYLFLGIFLCDVVFLFSSGQWVDFVIRGIGVFFVFVAGLCIGYEASEKKRGE